MVSGEGGMGRGGVSVRENERGEGERVVSGEEGMGECTEWEDKG